MVPVISVKTVKTARFQASTASVHYSSSTRLIPIMRSSYLFSSILLLCTASVAWAASSWTFDDATLSIQSKKAGVGGAQKEK